MRTKRKVFAVGVFLWALTAFTMCTGEQVFTDTFTGPNGVTIQDWNLFNVPNQGYWFYQDGELASGQGDSIITQKGYTYAVPRNPEVQNLRNASILAHVRTAQKNGTIILTGRWKDENNHYEGMLITFEGTRTLRIDKVSEGERTTLAKAVSGRAGVIIPEIENSKSSADSRPFKLYCIEDTIYLTFENNMIQASDSFHKTGAMGIGQQYNFAFFDNVIIETLAPDAVPQKVARREIGIPSEYMPTAVMPGRVYRIVMGTEMEKEMAAKLRDKLIGWGYGPVITLEKEGKYELRIGAFLTAEEAEGKKSYLVEEGLFPGQVVSELITAEEQRLQEQETRRRQFNVIVGSSPDRDSAEKVLQQLITEGYITARMNPTEEGFDVVAGVFASKTEATKFADVLYRDGYVMTRVEEQELTPLPIMMPVDEAVADVPGAEIIPKDVRESEVWRSLTKEQKESVVQMLMAEQELAKTSSAALSDDVVNIRQRVQSLSEEQREIISRIKQAQIAEQQKQTEVSEIIDQLGGFFSADQLDRARERLQALREIDPTNAYITLWERKIAFREQELPYEADEVVTDKQNRIQANIQAAMKAESDGHFETALDKWIEVQNEANENSEAYKRASNRILFIREQLAERAETAARAEKLQKMITFGTAGLVLLILLLVILVIIRARKRDKEILSRVRELSAMKPMLEVTGPREGEEEPRELPTQPSKLLEAEKKATEEPAAEESLDELFSQAPEEEVTATPEEETPEKPKAPVAPPAPEAPSEEEVSSPFAAMFGDVPADESAFESSEEETPSPETETVGAQSESEPGEDVALPDISDLFGEETTEKTEEQEREPVPSGVGPSAEDMDKSSTDDMLNAINLDDLNLDSIPEEKPAEASEIDMDIDSMLSEGFPEAPPQEEEEEKEQPSAEEAPELIPLEGLEEEPEAPPVPEITTEEPVTSEKKRMDDDTMVIKEDEKIQTVDSSITPSAPEVTQEVEMFYEQNFEDETIGESPRNWKGDTEFASLTVAGDNPPDGSTQYLKFEKTKEGGSAFFSCNIGDRRGTIIVEFDICCVEKNKYLLGFYIEKDGDFRQSIHTIVHYTEGKTPPSLRVQSEPTPYELNTWRHVKYVVDLLEGVLDCYVDDLLVGNSIKLASVPSYVNTLSIRDNIATKGTLLLDNIKVYKG